ncbi:selenocysteine-specific translation elongation factor [Luminiphilus sp.]|nr:selenocysteine-specific translation elongation factor [Luminiphilus sp.]
MIIATAGHVDHGKTSLVKQLSGVDTDRLEEEKQRGLSIELGYAFLQAEAGFNIGFIDVPGHHRFINTMISGVCSVDLALVVVAANEGPMPQTIEHLEVLRLLGVDQYVIVITHIDKIDVSERSGVAEALLASIQTHIPMASAPSFVVSNADRTGISELKQFLIKTAKNLQDKSERGYFRLSIDRVFHLQGSGLIVTGTSISGGVSVGDHLTLLPENKKVRVRSIHSQNAKTQYGRAGQRCALQLTGIKKSDLKRGDWLNGGSGVLVSHRFNARLIVSESLPFTVKHLSQVKIYIGAKRQAAKLYLLEESARATGLVRDATVLVQVIVETDIDCCWGDRFLVRDSSESTTIAGGIVLEPRAEPARVKNKEALGYLQAMGLPTFGQMLTELLVNRREALNTAHLMSICNALPQDFEAALHSAQLATRIHHFRMNGQDFCVLDDVWASSQRTIVELVECCYRDSQNMDGVPTDHLRVKCLAQLQGRDKESLLEAALVDLVNSSLLKRVGGRVRLPGVEPVVTAQEARDWELISTMLSQYKAQIPTLSDLLESLQLSREALQSALMGAVKDGRVHKISTTRFLLSDRLNHFAQSLTTLFETQGMFSVADARDHLGLGRNSCVDLLEYFDQVGVTRRDGDKRVVLTGRFLDRA